MTDQLLKEDTNKGKKQNDDDIFTVPDKKVVEKLNQAAVTKLSEIVRRNTAGEPQWQGYNAGEVAAAKDLVESAKTEVVR